jgi:hypothetical protein
MSKLVVFSRVAALGTLLGALAAACGGQSFNSGNGTNGGSGNEGGGSAGSHNTVAGKGHGGSTTMAGTNSGGSGTAGSGMSVAGTGNMSSGGSATGDACSGPSTTEMTGGGCFGNFTYWTHDTATGLCLPIHYGGCGGTQNLYKTLEECQAACPGGEPNYDACAQPADCMLASPGCCGVCDSPNVTTHDFVAYNRKYADKNVTCSGTVACGACPPPEGEPSLYNFVPSCEKQQCVVADLRTNAATACKTDADCKLRRGTSCCPSCAPDAPLIAVRNDGSFEKLVCGTLLPPCAACGEPTDPYVEAWCGDAGHCEVVYIDASTP